MKRQAEARPAQRYIALDIHKYYVMVGGMDAEQRWVLRPQRVRVAELESWCRRRLWATDEVVLESTSNAWATYDLLVPRVAKVVVANPLKVRQIALSPVKTDKLALEALLILLMADLVPEVWVPPAHVRELRGLISHRWRLNKQLVMTKNRLQSVLHRLNLTAPEGPLFHAENRGWWEAQAFSRALAMQVAQDLRLLDELTELKAALHAELTRMSQADPWADHAVYLMQTPGLGCILTMTVLGAIGDITRFAEAKKLVGYAGLGAGVHASGQKHQGKKITKAGRKELRWALVEAARTAVRTDPHWQTIYSKLCGRMPKHKALVAVARKMLVEIWQVWTKREARRAASAEMLARKMLTWAAKLPLEALEGMSRTQYAKYCLLKLGVREDITFVPSGRHGRRLPPAAEILALKPELKEAG